MAKFNREDLCEDYQWGNIPPEDSKVSGEPDSTHFDAGQGNEVLYLINALMSDWDMLSKKTGNKIERMIKDLPSEIHSQEDVKIWIKDKWKSYKFKPAKGRKPKKISPPPLPVDNSPTNDISDTGEKSQSHYCSNCNSVMPSEVIPSPMNESPDAYLLQALSGIHYVKHYRKCTHCGSEFETVEIDSSLLYELLRTKSLVEKFRRELDI